MDSKTAQSELQKFQSERKGAGDYYTQTQQELGVNEARSRQNELKEAIRNTEAQLKGVGESVAGRTRGNLVTEAQRSRLQALESQPIAEQLSGRQGAYSDAAQNYRDLLGQAGTQAGLLYQTDADRAAALESNYNRIFSAEQAAAAQKQQEEANRQWQAEMAERQRQFNEQIAQTNAQAAAQQASIASLYERQRSDTTADREREAAIQAEANRILSQSNTVTEQPYINKSTVGKGLIESGWENVKKYGPLAIFGGGTLWGW